MEETPIKETRICPQCNKEFELDKSKHCWQLAKFCSKYCQGKFRRSKPEYKEKIKLLQKDWEIKNKEHRLAYCREWEKENRPKRILKTKKWLEKNPHYHRDYHKRPNAQEREKKYKQTERFKLLSNERNKRYRINNPDYLDRLDKEAVRISTKKYLSSNKGIAKRLKYQNKKRLKFKKLIGKNYDEPTTELVKMVNERDIKCIYCECEFIKTDNHRNNPQYPSYDHLDCNLPFSSINMVRCCMKCNVSKNDTPVLLWLAKKKYPVNPIILELLNKLENVYKLKNLT